MIDYGDFIYHGMNANDAACLQNLQNSACRSILRADMYASTMNMHEELNIDMLYQRRIDANTL